MGFNAVLKFFLPTDKVFYTLFEQIVGNLKEMEGNFHQAVYETDRKIRKELLQKLKDGEHHNDHLSHKIFIELGQNFITPFDREDIHALAMALDDVADYMYAAAKKIINYRLQGSDEFMKNMANVINNSVDALSLAVLELRNMKHLKKISEICVTINSYENQADDLLDEGISKLFKEEKDAIELIKLKEIYQDMEIITDKCEDAANVIESIIIKYS